MVSNSNGVNSNNVAYLVFFIDRNVSNSNGVNSNQSYDR